MSGVGPVAQRLEQGTHNSLVPGSNPGGPFPTLVDKRKPHGYAGHARRKRPECTNRAYPVRPRDSRPIAAPKDCAAVGLGRHTALMSDPRENVPPELLALDRRKVTITGRDPVKDRLNRADRIIVVVPELFAPRDGRSIRGDEQRRDDDD